MMQWDDDDDAVREEEDNAYRMDEGNGGDENDDYNVGSSSQQEDVVNEEDDRYSDQIGEAYQKHVTPPREGQGSMQKKPLYDEDEEIAFSSPPNALPRSLPTVVPVISSTTRQMLLKQESTMLEQHMRSVVQSHVVAQTTLATRREWHSLSSDDKTAFLGHLMMSSQSNGGGIDASRDDSSAAAVVMQPWEPRPNDTLAGPLIRLVQELCRESMRREWLEERVVDVLHQLDLNDETSLRLVLEVVPEHHEEIVAQPPTEDEVASVADDENAAKEEALLRERMLKNPLLRIRADGEIDPEVEEGEETDAHLTTTKGKKKTTKRKLKSDDTDTDGTPGAVSGNSERNTIPSPYEEGGPSSMLRTFEEFFSSLLDPHALLAPRAPSTAATLDGVVNHLHEVECVARSVVKADEDTTRLTDDADVVLISECSEAFADVVENWTAASLPASVPEDLEAERQQLRQETAALHQANVNAELLASELREQLNTRRQVFDEKVAARRESSVVLNAEEMREALRQCRAMERELSAMNAAATQQQMLKEVEEYVRPLSRRLVDNEDVIKQLVQQIDSLEAVGRTSGLWALSHGRGLQRHHDASLQALELQRYQHHHNDLSTPYSAQSPFPHRHAAMVAPTPHYRRQDELVFLDSIHRVPRQ